MYLSNNNFKFCTLYRLSCLRFPSLFLSLQKVSKKRLYRLPPKYCLFTVQYQLISTKQLRAKYNLLYLKADFVPRSKHTPFRLKTNQLMLYTVKFSVILKSIQNP